MKRIMSVLVLLIAISVGCGTAMAQPENKAAQSENKTEKADKKQQREKREQLAERQARYISKSLGLDDKQDERFVETYCRAQKEVWDLNTKASSANRKARMRVRTDAETDKDMRERFDRSQKLLDIREKYYNEYSKFLSPKQIQRVYELEKNMRDQLRWRHNANKSKRQR